MKTFILGLSLIFSTSLLAKQIELKISSLYKKGEKVTKMNETRIIAKIGQEFTVPTTHDNPFQMKLNVSDFNEKVSDSIDPSKSIKLKGNISVLENGELKKVATPEVITVYGKEAMISTVDQDGRYFEMKVLPVKKPEKL